MVQKKGTDAVMPGFDPSTLEFYRRNARSYVGCRPDDPDPALMIFLDRLKPGAHILELGCGGGRDARYMRDRGFDLDATDGAPEMVAQAAAFAGTEVRLLRFDELEAVQEYDAVVANAALLHVPGSELTGILARVWRALRPGGWHFASYKSGGVEERDEHGRYYNRPTSDVLTGRYAGVGHWSVLDCIESQGVGHFSAPSRWLTITAQRAK